MKRVAVIGCCGAGKSIFSTKLHDLSGLPLYHLDQIFWKPDWNQEVPEIFQQKMEGWLAQDRWIIDGNYTRTLIHRIERADTIFFFDFPVWLCLLRVIKRAATYFGKSRPDMAEGCGERFDLKFLLYVSRFKKETRPRIIDALGNHARHCKIIVFKRPADVKAWIENFKGQV